tara:strand:+ start:1884 stop:2360 length:477 start_codon:yes stop_codon:yes gene_type:complete
MTQSTLQRLKELTTQLEVSESKESLLALRLKTVLNAAGAGIWDWELSKDILRWDSRMVKLFGYKEEDLKTDGEGWYLLRYRNFIERVHPADRERVQNSIDSCLHDNKPYRVTYRVVDNNGKEFLIIQASGDVYSDKTGKPERLVGVCIALETALFDGQ